MKKLLLILFSTVLFSCMDPQDTDFSTYEDGTAIEYYSFDGDFSLSQNWWSERDFFDDNECFEWEYCNLSEKNIIVTDNKFSFVDYYGDQRDCKFFQNLNVKSKFKKILLHCFGPSHNRIYEVDFDKTLLIQEYPTYSTYKIKLEPRSENSFPELSKIKGGQAPIISGLNQTIIDNDMASQIDSASLSRFDDEGFFVFANEIILDDGSVGGEIGGLVGAGFCYLMGWDIELCALGGSLAGEELTKNDGSITTQNLCIGYVHVDSTRIIDEYMVVCEQFDHPTSTDFKDYLPTELYDPSHGTPSVLKDSEK